MPGGEDHRRRDAAQRQRNLEIGGRREGGGDAGHDLVGNARVAERGHLLAGTSEHQRIAAFQAHHALALAAECDQQGVDLALALRMAALALADGKAFGVAAPRRDDRLRHQRIMNDGVGLHKQALRAQGQKVFGTRPGADERDMAGRRPGRQKQFARRFVCQSQIAAFRRAGRSAGEEIAPEAAPAVALGQQMVGGIAERGGEHGERTQRRRQHLVDARADHLGKHRSGPFRADGHRHRRAIDQRGGEEIAEFRTIHGVGRNAGTPRIGDHARVQHGVAARREDHDGTVQMVRRIGRVHDFAGLAGRPRRQFGHDFRGDDAQRRAGLGQQPCLRQRFLAAADNDDGPAVDFHEDGKGIQLEGLVLHRGIRTIRVFTARRLPA